jgi:hypothetical protein
MFWSRCINISRVAFVTGSERDDLSPQLRGACHLHTSNEGKSGLFDPESARHPTRDRLLSTAIECGMKLSIQVETQALSAIQSLEGVASYLPDLTLFAKVKKHLDIMAALALQAVRDHQRA